MLSPSLTAPKRRCRSSLFAMRRWNSVCVRLCECKLMHETVLAMTFQSNLYLCSFLFRYVKWIPFSHCYRWRQLWMKNAIEFATFLNICLKWMNFVREVMKRTKVFKKNYFCTQTHSKNNFNFFIFCFSKDWFDVWIFISINLTLE